MMENLNKLLQWPCNEPLNALRATSTRKTKTSFPPPPSEKKNPEVTMERLRYTLDQELRLGIFLLHKELNSYHEVVH